MTNIIIDEQEIEIIEYKGVRVITAQTIAKCHNTEVKIINQKFRRNRKQRKTLVQKGRVYTVFDKNVWYVCVVENDLLGEYTLLKKGDGSWFPAELVCEKLGFENHRNEVADLDDIYSVLDNFSEYESKVFSVGSKPEIFICKHYYLSLLFKSTKEEAIKYKNQVLTSLCKENRVEIEEKIREDKVIIFR